MQLFVWLLCVYRSVAASSLYTRVMTQAIDAQKDMAQALSDVVSHLRKSESLSGDGERFLNDLINSPEFTSDFFSLNGNERATEKKTGETIRIACLDIGSYRPQDMSYQVEGEHVLVEGRRANRINKGVEGSKFRRVLPIPEGVDPKRITARYSVRDGQYIVEGVKENSGSEVRKRRTSYARFDESRMSISVDLGSDRAQELMYNSGLRGNCSSQTNDKIVL